ncbi:MAG: Na/Pi symporter [Bacillota bacterium]|nr:Na/Pi symporter [Bacillota bacterium]MDW7682501.1 Na/Pi symporter [Bacillota bacterium]
MGTIISLTVGLVLFLGGLRLMSSALETMWGSSFAVAVQRMTGNRLSAFLCGLLFTTVTQSSSLATVIVVGVVDAGLIGLGAAIAVIIGANVGTTVTGQLLSFKIDDYSLVFALLGMLLLLVSRPGKQRNAGKALTGLGVLLVGLQTMAEALIPFAETGWMEMLLRHAAAHPVAGIVSGALVTAIVQSSSAVVGMTVALAREGILSLAAGAAIIVGADVGTCVTSLLAGLGAGLTARRAALAHLLFNVFSVMIVITVFPLFVWIASQTSDILPRQLANAHTLYNLTGAVIMLLLLTPFQKLVERLTDSENPSKKRIFGVFGEFVARWF